MSEPPPSVSPLPALRSQDRVAERSSGAPPIAPPLPGIDGLTVEQVLAETAVVENFSARLAESAQSYELGSLTVSSESKSLFSCFPAHECNVDRASGTVSHSISVYHKPSIGVHTSSSPARDQPFFRERTIEITSQPLQVKKNLREDSAEVDASDPTRLSEKRRRSSARYELSSVDEPTVTIDELVLHEDVQVTANETEEERMLYRRSVLHTKTQNRLLTTPLPRACEAHELLPDEKIYLEFVPMRLMVSQHVREPLFATVSLWGYAPGSGSAPLKLSADWCFHFVSEQLHETFLRFDPHIQPPNRHIRRGVLCVDSGSASRFTDSQIYVLVQLQRVFTDDHTARAYAEDKIAFTEEMTARVLHLLENQDMNQSSSQAYALHTFAWGAASVLSIAPDPQTRIKATELPMHLISTRTTRRRFKLDQLASMFEGKYKTDRVSGAGLYFTLKRLSRAELWQGLRESSAANLVAAPRPASSSSSSSSGTHSTPSEASTARSSTSRSAESSSASASPSSSASNPPSPAALPPSLSGAEAEAHSSSSVASTRLDMCLLNEFSAAGAWIMPSPWLAYTNDLFVHQLSLNLNSSTNVLLTAEVVDCKRGRTVHAACSRYAGGVMIPRATTTVQSSPGKQYCFADELQLRLPCDFREHGSMYYLMYVAWEVSVAKQAGKQVSRATRRPVAYGLQPLWATRDADPLFARHPLEIPLTLASAVPTPQEIPALQPSAKPKYKLIVNLCFQSTLYPPQESLRNILTTSSSSSSSSVGPASTASVPRLPLAEEILQNFPSMACVDFFPHLCRVVLSQLTAAGSDEARAADAFRALVALLYRSQATSLSPQQLYARLLYYLEHLFEVPAPAQADHPSGHNKHDDSPPLYQVLAEQWEKYSESKACSRSLRIDSLSLGFLWALAHRAFVGHVARQASALPPGTVLQFEPRRKLTEADRRFFECLTTLFPHAMRSYEGGIGFESVPLALNAFLSVSDPGAVVQLLHRGFVAHRNEDPMHQHWIAVSRCLQVLLTHPDAVALSLPHLTGSNLTGIVGRSLRTAEFHSCIFNRYLNNNFLPNLLLKEIRSALGAEHQSYLSMLLGTLHVVLVHYHATHKKHPAQIHPTTVFFPFFLVVLEHEQFFVSADLKLNGELAGEAVSAQSDLVLKRVGLVCLLDILHSSRGSVLNSWLRMSAVSSLHKYLNLLLGALVLLTDSEPPDTVELAPRFTVLDLLEDFVHDFEGDLKTERGQPLLEKVLDIYLQLLHEERPSCKAFVSNLCLSLKTPITDFASILFAPDKFFCQDLVNELIVHWGSKCAVLRDRSVSLVYYMLCLSYATRGPSEYSFMATRLHIAVSQFVGPRSETHYCEKVNEALHAIGNFMQSDPLANKLSAAEVTASLPSDLQQQTPRAQPPGDAAPYAEQSFVEQTTRMLQELEKVSRSQLLVCGGNVDPDLRAEHFATLANNFFLVPDLRITWLRNLGQENERALHFVEAAQCAILEAYLCTLFLRERCGEPLPLSDALFERVMPNLGHILKLPTREEVPDKEFTGHCWSFAGGLIPALNLAVRLLSCPSPPPAPAFAGHVPPPSATVFETKCEAALDVLQIVQLLHKYDNDFRSLLVTCSRYERICSQAMLHQQEHSQAELHYYYVRFHAPHFAQLHGGKFVYKSLLAIREFSAALRRMLVSAYEAEPAITHKVAEYETPASDFVVLVITVQPHYGDEEEKEEKASESRTAKILHAPSRVTYDQLHSNLRHFAYEFSPGGQSPQPPKPKAEMSESERTEWDHFVNAVSRKTRVVVTTRLAFPHLGRRLPVASKRVVAMSGLETRVDELRGQVSQLRTALYSLPPNLKKLEQLLFGTFCAGVGGGLKPLCSVYLDPSRPPPEDRADYAEASHALRLVVAELLQLALVGVEVMQRDSPNQALVEELTRSTQAFEREFRDRYWQGARFSIWKSDWTKTHKQQELQSQLLSRKFRASDLDLHAMARRQSHSVIQRRAVSSAAAGDAAVPAFGSSSSASSSHSSSSHSSLAASSSSSSVITSRTQSAMGLPAAAAAAAAAAIPFSPFSNN